jgi:hypothetical protein
MLSIVPPLQSNNRMRAVILIPLLAFALTAQQKASVPTAGTYRTSVKLIDEKNTCGVVEVRDNPTTFANITQTSFVLTHAGSTYEATIESGEHFRAEKELHFNDYIYIIKIAGRFESNAFHADVDVQQRHGDKTCKYEVKWDGKLGD